MRTVVDWPGSSHTFLNATSRFGGSPASGGRPRYTCGTSAPRRFPVFVTFKDTMMGRVPSDARADRSRLVSLNVVYESP